MNYLPHRISRFFKRFMLGVQNKKALRRLKRNKELYDTLQGYLIKSNSTGCSNSDYWVLYEYVREKKPKEILECGTGVTTVVMAYALMENMSEGNGKGRITSMEDQKEWYESAVKLLPRELSEFVEIKYSEKTEYSYSLFRGVGYKDVPQRPYELVFVDGPETTAPSDGTSTFDFDFINVLKTARNPVFGIIDNRLPTSFVYKQLLGNKKVRFDPQKDLSFVGPCTRMDLK